MASPPDNKASIKRLKKLSGTPECLCSDLPGHSHAHGLVGTVIKVPSNYLDAAFAKQSKSMFYTCRIIGYVPGARTKDGLWYFCDYQSEEYTSWPLTLESMETIMGRKVAGVFPGEEPETATLAVGTKGVGVFMQKTVACAMHLTPHNTNNNIHNTQRK